MSRRGVWPLLMVLGMLAVSCGSGEGEGTSTTPDATTPVPTPTTEATTTAAEQPADGPEIEAYLVEMSNLAADVDTQLSDFECSYNEQFSPGFCGGFEDGGFVEEGDEYEPPPEPSEEEQFAYQQGLWLGMFDIQLAHADVLGAVDVPNGFESAHQDYVNSYRSYFTYVRDQVAGFGDLDELFEFFNAIFDPLAAVPVELEQLFLAMVETCRSVQDLGTGAGYRSDLGCPTPPPEPVSMTVETGDQWSATPNPLPVGDGLVQMTITNTGAEPIRPVVLDIFEGDPLDLPLVDGVVDISKSGEFDPASGFAEFVLAYAGENEVFIDEFGVTGEPPELLPGESVEAALWSEGTMVVFDYQPGQFEAGAYVVVERSGT